MEASISSFMLVARTSRTGQIRAFRRAPFSAWASFGSYATGGSPVVDLKIAPLDGYTGSAWFAFSRANGALDLVLYGDVNNGNSNYVPNGVSGFDIFSKDGVLWIVASANGQIQMSYSIIGSGTFQPYPGPLRGGMPSSSLNSDTMCFADHPEIVQTRDKLFVSWEERCGGGPWKMMVRSLN